MRDIKQIFGKRLKAGFPVTMYRRFPNSKQIETLPPGKPSPLIDSYTKSGYFQLENGQENLYVKDAEGIEVVPPNVPDDSVFFDSIIAGVSDWFGNTGRQLSKQAGFLQDGFKESISGVKTDFFNFSGALAPIIWGLVALFSLYLISKLTK